MEQIAHQAVVMQFIMEMAKNCNVDPRGCFRLFFQKAKVSSYLVLLFSFLLKDNCCLILLNGKVRFS